MGDLSSPGATARRSIKLDPATNEVVFVNGKVVWLSGAAAVAQSIRLAFGMLKGEWFLDKTRGADWYSVLGERYDDAVARSMARSVLQSVDGVDSITSLQTSFNAATRRVSITWAVSTDYGPLEGKDTVKLP